jgi:hypothetical protein
MRFWEPHQRDKVKIGSATCFFFGSFRLAKFDGNEFENRCGLAGNGAELGEFGMYF